MRPNQFGLQMLRFGKSKPKGCDDDFYLLNIYSDSHSLYKAMLNMLAEAVVRLYSDAETPIDPRGCACESQSSADPDEQPRRFAQMLAGDWRRNKADLIDGLIGTDKVLVRVNIQRFPTALPEGFPAEEFAAVVTSVADDPFEALVQAYIAVFDEVRKYEDATPAELTVRTNFDPVEPLVGDLGRMKLRSERIKAMREAAGDDGE